MYYEIDLTKAKTRADLYDLLEEALPLPDYFGRNLDALYDVLSEIPEAMWIRFRDLECREYDLERYLRRLKRMSGGLMEENPNIRIAFDSDDDEEGQ
ncbi:MAG: barstar family protein [Firmicutes bacterium]|jgi:ribonuclease inhibitor|nr:barstar family protein [Bacillota bacterium]MBR6503799.1 barstar family protein [Bacillota bacterium]